MLYELDCRYDTRASFYGKAKVLEQTMSDWKEIDLYSYGTLVAKIIETKNIENISMRVNIVKQLLDIKKSFSNKMG